MSKIFYDHLVLIDDVLVEIESLVVETDEKNELKKLADSTIHHGIVTHILDLLPNVHHEEFLEGFHSAPHDLRHLSYLDKKIKTDIQAEIVMVGKKIKKELLAEIKKHKSKK